MGKKVAKSTKKFTVKHLKGAIQHRRKVKGIKHQKAAKAGRTEEQLRRGALLTIVLASPLCVLPPCPAVSASMAATMPDLPFFARQLQGTRGADSHARSGSALPLC